MTDLLCEKCGALPARAYEDKGHFCREHRPLPSPSDLVAACREALDEERFGDLARLIGMLVTAVTGLHHAERRSR